MMSFFKRISQVISIKTSQFIRIIKMILKMLIFKFVNLSDIKLNWNQNRIFKFKNLIIYFKRNNIY